MYEHLKGRNAQGGILLRLLPGEEIVGVVAGRKLENIVTLSNRGRLSYVDASRLATNSCGDMGSMGSKSRLEGEVIADMAIGSSDLYSVVYENGKSRRFSNEE